MSAPDDRQDWGRWVDGDPPPPSWGLVFELCVAALLVLAILADLWLPALDQHLAWLGGGR